MTTATSIFWDDLNEDLKDPEFRARFDQESARIAAVDYVINLLDEQRVAQGMSKAELARAISRRPEVVRRLFTARTQNPQLALVAEVAGALGCRVTLERDPAVTHQRRACRKVTA